MELKLNDIEKAILLRHDPGVRQRALIELLIVDRLIEEAKKAGYHLKAEADGEQIATYPGPKRDAAAFKSAIFEYEDVWVLVERKGKSQGWIQLVFGNSGYDLISDYSTSLHAFLTPVFTDAEFWG